MLLLLGGLLLLSACEKTEELLAGDPVDGLWINEVVTSNQLSLVDDVYGSPDWIELYNGSQTDIHLSNYYLTDNVEAPQKATRLPDVTLAPGGYYLLFANKKDGTPKHPVLLKIFRFGPAYFPSPWKNPEKEFHRLLKKYVRVCHAPSRRSAKSRLWTLPQTLQTSLPEPAYRTHSRPVIRLTKTPVTALV